MAAKSAFRRREFLQTVAVAPAVASGQATSSSGSAMRRLRLGAGYAREFRGAQLSRIAFPLGGVGAGCISLGGRGQLRDWEIFNRPDKGKSPRYAFASLWVENPRGKPLARVLEGRLQPPYDGASGLGTNNVPGLPRLETAVFTGEFPFARVRLTDGAAPVEIELEAFSPFIPLDAEDSGLPVAFLRYRVRNRSDGARKIAIAFSLDNPVGAEGRVNDFRAETGLAGFLMRNPFLAANEPLAGTFTLALIPPPDGKVTALRGWKGGSRWRVGPQWFWDDFAADGSLSDDATVRDTTASLCLAQQVPAGGSADYTFLLAWHFPNRTPRRCGWSAPKGFETVNVGNHYATRFGDSWAAARYAVDHLASLESRTRAFQRALAESTLPAEVLEAAAANLTTLVTPTCFRTADGQFHGFEGCNDQSGCCFGSCTHVWNYETTVPHLFPTLSRSMREAAFGFSTDERGLQEFRHYLPYGSARWGYAAADGQMGALMRLYLDWRLSGDTVWLRRHWPAARRAMEFSWIAGGWDADKDGVMEGVQHNTYDVEFFGPNPLCGIWYLGGLRAVEEMARAVGDAEMAATCRRLFENGSKWIDAHLFTGEYYIQKVTPVAKDKVVRGLTVGMGAASTETPEFQLGEGCLVDQLCGQYFADAAGLGNLLDPVRIRKTLESIYRYNYRRNLYEHESVQRVYALNDEAGLLVCSYPEGKRPEIPFPYFAEVWTGLEYQAAALMMARGMVAEGIEVIANVRKRYDGERRNPYDEAECGHHYARAMAAWSGILALSGFSYDAGARKVTAHPRLDVPNFRCMWSAGTGWGTFSLLKQKTAEFYLNLAAGKLVVARVELPPMPAGRVSLQIGDAAVNAKVERLDGGTQLTLPEAATLTADQPLRVRVA